MSDFERLLRSSLQDVGEAYEPSDRAGARERFLRRKRRRRIRVAVSGVVVTASIVAVALFAAPLAVDDPPIVLTVPEPVATVSVGEAPSSLVAGADEVWVAESEDMAVSRIDPASNEVVETVRLEGRPDEVAAGDSAVWVADDSGVVTRIEVAAPEAGEGVSDHSVRLIDRDGPVHLDLAVTRTGAVAVDPLGGTVHELTVTSSGSVRSSQESVGFGATDVASGDEGMWLLDGPDGELTAGQEVFPVPGGWNADLAVGAGAVWVASGTEGGVYKIDPSSGEVVGEVRVGGRYTDLAVADDTVWALTGGDGPSRLHEIDGRTGEAVGEPLEMEGDPSDVTVSDGSAWVADAESAEVVRIDPGGTDTAPLPTTEPTPEEEAKLVDPDDLVFVYSADGELFAQTEDREVRLTHTEEAEVHPSVSSDGRYIAFERVGDDENDRTVSVLDVATGEECCRREGAWPAFGPHNQLAWVVPSHGLVETDEQAMITIGPMEGPPTKQVSAAPPNVGVPFSVQDLAWDPSGEVLAYEAGYEGTNAYLLDLMVGSDGLVERAKEPTRVPAEGEESGAVYTGLSSAGNTPPTPVFSVIRACCLETEGDAYTEDLEFGQLIAQIDSGGAYPYNTLIDLSDLGLQVENRELFSSFAGAVEAVEDDDGDLIFRESERSASLIGDGLHMWLVASIDEVTRLPYEVHGGASAPHQFFE